MKKYFQKLYNETGQKPFTFLNCFLNVLLPLVVFILAAIIIPNDGDMAMILIGLSFVIGLVANVLVLFKRFKDGKRVAICFILGLLASVAFFCKLILFPLFKLLLNLMGGAASVQTGDFAGASAQNNRAFAEAGSLKTSAFNWFIYDDRVIEDIHIEAQESTMANDQAWNSELQRNFTSDEDTNARNMGYRDAKQAYDSGVSLADITKK